MNAHTKEPWEADGTLVFMGNNEGGFDIWYCPVPEANARRIVACVNACVGIPNNMLEAAGQSAVMALRPVDELIQQREALLIDLAAGLEREDALKKQCDELLKALREVSISAREGVTKMTPELLSFIDAAIAKVKL